MYCTVRSFYYTMTLFNCTAGLFCYTVFYARLDISIVSILLLIHYSSLNTGLYQCVDLSKITPRSRTLDRFVCLIIRQRIVTMITTQPEVSMD